MTKSCSSDGLNTDFGIVMAIPFIKALYQLKWFLYHLFSPS